MRRIGQEQPPFLGIQAMLAPMGQIQTRLVGPNLDFIRPAAIIQIPERKGRARQGAE